MPPPGVYSDPSANGRPRPVPWAKTRVAASILADSGLNAPCFGPEIALLRPVRRLAFRNRSSDSKALGSRFCSTTAPEGPACRISAIFWPGRRLGGRPRAGPTKVAAQRPGVAREVDRDKETASGMAGSILGDKDTLTLVLLFRKRLPHDSPDKKTGAPLRPQPPRPKGLRRRDGELR